MIAYIKLLLGIIATIAVASCTVSPATGTTTSAEVECDPSIGCTGGGGGGGGCDRLCRSSSECDSCGSGYLCFGATGGRVGACLYAGLVDPTPTSAATSPPTAVPACGPNDDPSICDGGTGGGGTGGDGGGGGGGRATCDSGCNADFDCRLNCQSGILWECLRGQFGGVCVTNDLPK